MKDDRIKLVGMTQGARKRAARRDAVTSQPDGRFTDVGAEHPKSLRRTVLSIFSACLVTDTSVAEIRGRYIEARARYSVGRAVRS